MAALSFVTIALIVLVLGILIPVAVVLALPFRAAWLISRGSPAVRAMTCMLLLPWAYYTSVILVAGYVSPNSYGTGPTINPYVWTAIGLAWLVPELVFREAKWESSAPRQIGVLLAITAMLVPLLSATATPARCLYLVVAGKPTVRALSLALLCLWGWYAAQQATSWSGLPRSWGIVTANMAWYAWISVAVAWFFVEVVQYQPQKFRKYL